MYGKRVKSLTMFGCLVCILCILVGNSNIYSQKREIVQPDKEVLVVLSPGPLYSAARVLGQMYQKPVSYEGPLDLPWDGDIDLVPVANGRIARIPKRGKFVIPDDVTPDKNKQLDEGVLEKILEAYQKQIDGPKFKISRTKSVLHFIVDEVRDKNGQYVKEKPFLDAVISVPSEKMTSIEHIKKIVDAVNASNEIKLWINYGPGYDFLWLDDITGNIPNKLDMYTGNYDENKLKFEWGADGVTAREALVDLLEKANTTLSFRVDCATDNPKNYKDCWIEIFPLEVNYLEPNGKKIRTNLYYDRIKEK